MNYKVGLERRILFFCLLDIHFYPSKGSTLGEKMKKKKKKEEDTTHVFQGDGAKKHTDSATLISQRIESNPHFISTDKEGHFILFNGTVSKSI
jgi:hypothetical protein